MRVVRQPDLARQRRRDVDRGQPGRRLSPTSFARHLSTSPRDSGDTIPLRVAEKRGAWNQFSTCFFGLRHETSCYRLPCPGSPRTGRRPCRDLQERRDLRPRYGLDTAISAQCFSGNDTNRIDAGFDPFGKTGWIPSDKNDKPKGTGIVEFLTAPANDTKGRLGCRHLRRADRRRDHAQGRQRLRGLPARHPRRAERHMAVLQDPVACLDPLSRQAGHAFRHHPGSPARRGLDAARRSRRAGRAGRAEDAPPRVGLTPGPAAGLRGARRPV